MRLQILHDGPWKIVAPLSGEGAEVTCELLEQLEDLRNAHEASVIGLYTVWERINRFGPRALGTGLYHLVDEENGIYEFIKGRIRVLCFESHTGAICVCSHVLLKSSQKTPKAAIKLAIRLKAQFSTAFAAGTVQFVTEE